jgi:polyphosphate kinase 2 (PPK2 family)
LGDRDTAIVARLDEIDLGLKLGRREGDERLLAAQRRMLALRLQCAGLLGDGKLGPPLCVVFEGWDASGKGGAIRRLVAPLDPRHVRVAQFAAPSDDEKRHHFLHRFWPAMPGWGGMAVLDRTWYGRVLVERVEGFASKADYTRAYDEIVAFESALCAEGMVLVKFWLHVSKGEQERRFRERELEPLKQWKLTGEDWRNIKRRGDYEKALEEMFERTDHEAAPWQIVSAESKRYARVAVLDAVIEAAERGLRATGREPVSV